MGATNTLTLPAGSNSTLVSESHTQTLTNKSLTAPTITGTAVMADLDISGDVDVKSDIDAKNTFGDSVKHYIKGEALHGSGSTIIDLREEGGKILREGPLKWPPSYC